MADRVSAELRQLVRERTGGRCEYCLIAEADVFFPHEPDHIVAIKHGGQTVIENLAWACFACNRRKGSDLASIDPEGRQISRLFHPRIDRWNEHFAIEGARIVGTTPVGRATMALLGFNHPGNVKVRRLLIRLQRWPG